MWIVRDKDGYLFGFNHKPIRTVYDECGWYGWVIDPDKVPSDVSGYQIQLCSMLLPKELFPDLKWEDEPIEVSLVRESQ